MPLTKLLSVLFGVALLVWGVVEFTKSLRAWSKARGMRSALNRIDAAREKREWDEKAIESLSPADEARLRNEFKAKARQAVYIELGRRPLPKDASSPTSYFGGLPQLPADQPWPSFAESGQPSQELTFLAQVDLADLPELVSDDLPDSGRLLFFCFGQTDALPEPERRDWARVVYVPDDAAGVAERDAPDTLMEFSFGYMREWFAGRDNGWVADRLVRHRVDRRYPVRFATYRSFPDGDGDLPAAGWDHGSLHEHILAPLLQDERANVRQALAEQSGAETRPMRDKPEPHAHILAHSPYLWREADSYASSVQVLIDSYLDPDPSLQAEQIASRLDEESRSRVQALHGEIAGFAQSWRDLAASKDGWAPLTEDERTRFRQDLKTFGRRINDMRMDIRPYDFAALRDIATAYEHCLNSKEAHERGPDGAEPDLLRREARDILKAWLALCEDHHPDSVLPPDARLEFNAQIAELAERCHAAGQSFYPKHTGRSNERCPLYPPWLPAGLDSGLPTQMVWDGMLTACELGLDVEALYPGWVIDRYIPDHDVDRDTEDKFDFEWGYGPHQMLGFGTTVQWAPEEHADKVLLLQVYSDDRIAWHGGSCVLQYWIDPDDLRQGRFDRAFATLECN